MGNPQPLAVVHEEELEHDPKVPQQPALLPEDGGEMERAGELDSGQRVLHALGYRQELRREFGLFASFSSSLALMAYSSGLTGFFAIAYTNGGPVSAIWGWILVMTTNFFVALSMAEIVSAYPIAGGPYFWCLELLDNDPKYVLIGWLTGWMNVLGQFAATAANASLLANHIGVMWLLGNGHVFSPVETLLAYAIILVLAGSVSSVSTSGVRFYSILAGMFLIFSGLFVVILLPIIAPVRQSASFVFLQFDATDMDSTGLPNVVYLFLVGMLMAQGTFIGFEAPAQFAEETRRADKTVPRAIVLSVLVCGVLGFSYLLTILFCIQSVGDLTSGIANGYIVGQVFYDIFMGRFGSGVGAILLMTIPMITTFNSTSLSLTTNARVLWSFSRDGGVPLYKVWAAINWWTGTPVNAVWAMAALAFLMGLPMLFSFTVFEAILSISSVGLYASYVVPILLRLAKHRRFKPGPFRLGWMQVPCNLAAISWIAVMTAAFIVPTTYPVSSTNLNWTPVTVGIVLALVLGAWFLPGCGAARWYQGKSHTLESFHDVRGSGRYSQAGEEKKGGTPSSGVGHPSQKISLIGLMDDVRTKSKAPLAGVALTRSPQAAAAGKPPSSPPSVVRRKAQPRPPPPPPIPEMLYPPPGMNVMMQQPPQPYWGEYGGYGSSVPVTASPPPAAAPLHPAPQRAPIFAPAAASEQVLGQAQLIQQPQQQQPKVASLFVAAPVSVVSPFSAGKHFPRHTLPNIYEMPAAAAAAPKVPARSPKAGAGGGM